MFIDSVAHVANELRRIAGTGRSFTSSELFEGDNSDDVGMGHEYTTTFALKGANSDGATFSLFVVQFFDGQLYLRSVLKWTSVQGDEHTSSARYLLDQAAIEHLDRRADKLNALSDWNKLQLVATIFWQSAFSQTRRFIKDTTRYGMLFEQNCNAVSSDAGHIKRANRAHLDSLMDAKSRHEFLCMLTPGPAGTVNSWELEFLLRWIEAQDPSPYVI